MVVVHKTTRERQTFVRERWGRERKNMRKYTQEQECYNGTQWINNLRKRAWVLQ